MTLQVSILNLRCFIMKVKLFDESDEIDLQNNINRFITDNDVSIIDIKYQVAIGIFSEEQIYCFSAMVIYET